MTQISNSNDIQRLSPGARLCEATIYNGVVYLAGQVPEDHPDADFQSQVREVLGHIDRRLAEAGSHKTRILQCQIFLKNIADIGAMNEVWDAWVPAGHPPARATVQAALADPRWSIEVVVTAACGPAA